jgi:hypothetical protein
VTALVEQTGLGVRQGLDLLRGAVVEWGVPSRVSFSMRESLRWFTAAFACCVVVTVIFDGPAQVGRSVSVDALMGAASVMLRVYLLARIPVLILMQVGRRAGKPITADERWKAQLLFGVLAMLADRALAASFLPGMSQQQIGELFGSGADWFVLLPAFLPNWQRPYTPSSHSAT